jgi:hypothetical protein
MDIKKTYRYSGGTKMKLQKLITTLAVLSITALLAPNAALAQDPNTSAEKIDLKLNLTEGVTYSTLMIMDQKISQTVQGRPIDVNQIMSMTMDSEVLAVEPNGTTTLTVTYSTMKLKMDGPMGTIDYDSQNPVIDSNDPQTAMMVAMYSAMLDQKITMKLTPKGKILQIDGFDEMMENMMDQLPGEDPNMVQAMKDMMKNFISEDKFEEMGQGMVSTFPDWPVGIGDVWYDTMSLGAGFPIDLDVTNILKDRKDGVTVIESVAKMDMGDPNSSLIEVEGMNMNLQLSGTQNSTTEVDEATGWTIAADTIQNFTGVMKIEPNPQMPEGMAIPMSIKGTVTVKSVQKL